MVKKAERGSITIFGVLVLVLTMECLLLLAEGARFCTIKRSAYLQSQSAMESVFASYCSLLWQEYHLLGCNQSQMENVLISYANGRNSEDEWRKNLIGFPLEQVKINRYTLITDGNGDAFQQAVSGYMKDTILYEAAKAIYGQYEVIQHILDSEDPKLEKIDEALERLEGSSSDGDIVPYQLRRGGKAEENGETPNVFVKSDIADNPLDGFKRIQNMKQLEPFIKDTSTISKKYFDQTRAVSVRELSQGKDYQIPEGDWIDRILLQQYLLTYFSSYADKKEDHGILYEIEYLIGGQDSDIENLKVVTDNMLLIRQAANMLYIFSDSAKVEEANAVATALTTATAMPELYELVKVALLAAWAYGESILDVRGLLQGKRIPLLKSAETWTLQLSEIGGLAEDTRVAKESEMGLTYRDYLGIMLLMTPDSKLSMRAMDMQEATIRGLSKDSEFCMDTLMIQAEATISYHYKPIFGGSETMVSDFIWDYHIEHKINYQYGS